MSCVNIFGWRGVSPHQLLLELKNAEQKYLQEVKDTSIQLAPLELNNSSIQIMNEFFKLRQEISDVYKLVIQAKNQVKRSECIIVYIQTLNQACEKLQSMQTKLVEIHKKEPS